MKQDYKYLLIFSIGMFVGAFLTFGVCWQYLPQEQKEIFKNE